METGARLAAYLSGDLAPDEHAAVAAELDRDPALRARLERIREADRALAELPAAELSEEAARRLHEVVDDELGSLLGDELAARRARRVPRWVPATAAAALVVVVGGGVVLTSLPGGEDTATTEAGAPEAAMDGDAGGQEAADSQLRDDTTAESAAPLGPRIVAADRTLDEEALAQLAADPAVLDALGGRSVDDPSATAASYARVLGVASERYLGPGAGTDEAGGGPEADQEEGRSDDLQVVARGEVTASDREDVAECLPILQEDASSVVVPLYAEVGTTEDGTDVIAYAALAPDDTGAYQRVEVWLVERSSCSLLRFVQHDR